MDRVYSQRFNAPFATEDSLYQQEASTGHLEHRLMELNLQNQQVIFFFLILTILFTHTRFTFVFL